MNNALVNVLRAGLSRMSRINAGNVELLLIGNLLLFCMCTAFGER